MNSKWPKVMLMSAVSSILLLFEIATASVAPRLALAFLQYSLVACVPAALIGSAVIYATDR